MGKIMRLIPPLLMLLGVILITSGIFGAMYSITTYPTDKAVTIYPRLFEGSVILIFGIAISVFSYLIIHNKIEVAKYFK